MAADRRAIVTDSTMIVGLVCAHFLVRPFLYPVAVAPNLLIGALLLAALRLSAGWAALLGFVLGVLEAAMALAGLGRISLVLMLVGYLSARSRDLLFADARFFVYAYLFLGTWVAESGLAVALGGASDPIRLLLQAPASAALTAVLCGALESVVSRTRV